MPPKPRKKPPILDQLPDFGGGGDQLAPDRPPAPVDADGIARGCRRPGSIGIGLPLIGMVKDMAGLIPSWVQATDDPRTRDKRDIPREVTGRLMQSNTSREDFPLAPWHRSYDWNYFIRPDPRHRNLLSTVNVAKKKGRLECEWEERHLPAWARPWGVGNRIWTSGRWIYDCGHPEETANGFEYYTEIHPPRAVATFVRTAAKLRGNSAPTRVTQAVVFIGSLGGYHNTDITDRSYSFEFSLPPKPRGKNIKPVFSVRRKSAAVLGGVPGFSKILVPVTSTPTVRPRVRHLGGRKVRVVIPLKDAKAKALGRVLPLGAYGLIVSAGWSDPDGSQAREIVRRRVTLDTFFMDANKDPLGRDEWYVYFGVNGRWWDFKSIGGDKKKLGKSATLLLHPDDPIEISVSGFEADTTHDVMGNSIGVKRSEVGAGGVKSGRARDIAAKVRNELLGNTNENDKLAHLVIRHNATTTGTFTKRNSKKEYRLRYTLA